MVTFLKVKPIEGGLAANPAAEATGQVAARRRVRGRRSSRSGLEPSRLLVVDDDRDMRAYLEDELREAGYAVRTAADAIDGLITLLGETPDVVVLDWKMPIINGLTLLSSIRRCAPDVPVILVSAYAPPETAVRALREGAHAFLAKPFAISQLLEEIEGALSRRTPVPSGEGREDEFEALLRRTKSRLTADLEPWSPAQLDLPVRDQDRFPGVE